MFGAREDRSDIADQGPHPVSVPLPYFGPDLVSVKDILVSVATDSFGQRIVRRRRYAPRWRLFLFTGGARAARVASAALAAGPLGVKDRGAWFAHVGMPASGSSARHVARRASARRAPRSCKRLIRAPHGSSARRGSVQVPFEAAHPLAARAQGIWPHDDRTRAPLRYAWQRRSCSRCQG